MAQGQFQFTGTVPTDLLEHCEKERTRVQLRTARKATNLYRRVSVTCYADPGNGTRVKSKPHRDRSVQCLCCLITLTRTSKDIQRSGIKLRCPCHVRVCHLCFKNNSEWYLTSSHFASCKATREYICALCSCFGCVKEKVCCLWMCPQCSSQVRERDGLCPECSRALRGKSCGETHRLWCEPGSQTGSRKASQSTCSEEKMRDYRDLVRQQVFAKVSQSRHVSSEDLNILFQEPQGPQTCTCFEGEQNPMCVKCTPTLTVMRLLARNPRPLVSSFAEDLPLCANGENCKGLSIGGPCEPAPLTSLISPEAFQRHLECKSRGGSVGHIAPTSCILCLLFNQSAALVQMLSPHGLHREPHPLGPVYYFNIKLAPDVGLPEVHVYDYPGNVVQFEGTVGVFKPTFYYNWRDMLRVLKREWQRGECVITISIAETSSTVEKNPKEPFGINSPPHC